MSVQLAFRLHGGETIKTTIYPLSVEDIKRYLDGALKEGGTTITADAENGSTVIVRSADVLWIEVHNI